MEHGATFAFQKAGLIGDTIETGVLQTVLVHGQGGIFGPRSPLLLFGGNYGKTRLRTCFVGGCMEESIGLVLGPSCPHNVEEFFSAKGPSSSAEVRVSCYPRH